MNLQILMVTVVLFISGCTQTVFVNRSDDCTEIYGRGATQSMHLDSERIGDLRASNHHTGGPPDTVLLEIGPELGDIGVEYMSLTKSWGDGVFSGCAMDDQNQRTCFVKNSQHAAGRMMLNFRATTDAESWQVLRDVQDFWDSIANCETTRPLQK